MTTTHAGTSVLVIYSYGPDRQALRFPARIVALHEDTGEALVCSTASASQPDYGRLASNGMVLVPEWGQCVRVTEDMLTPIGSPAPRAQLGGWPA